MYVHSMNLSIKWYIFFILCSFVVKNSFSQQQYENKKIKFIESVAEYSTLEEFLSRPIYKNKIVYIDLWGTTCLPCLREFKYMNTLKKKLKNYDISFLFICQNTQGDTNNEWKRKWKSIVNKYQLEGTHIYTYLKPPDKFVHEKIDFEYMKKNINEPLGYGIPRYLIAKGGKILIYNAYKPSDVFKLTHQIDSLNLF